MANYIGELLNPGKFRTKFKSSVTGIESNQATSNLSPSNIIGFFDKPDRNLKGKGAPCRLTAFNRDYPELWNNTQPFLNEIDKQFKELVPKHHKLQYERCQQTPEFAIGNTAFSTVTINYSWRTALHKDAGDLKQGYGNLVVLEEGKYKGGSTGFPQFGVAVDVRHGDFLAMDVHEWHCNTKLHGITKEYTRLSLVAYLRENMLRCKGMKKV